MGPKISEIVGAPPLARSTSEGSARPIQIAVRRFRRRTGEGFLVITREPWEVFFEGVEQLSDQFCEKCSITTARPAPRHYGRVRHDLEQAGRASRSVSADCISYRPASDAGARLGPSGLGRLGSAVPPTGHA